MRLHRGRYVVTMLADLFEHGLLRPGLESGRSVDEKVISLPWDVSLDAVGELWVRGPFASTLWPDVDDLDVVIFYHHARLREPDSWPLQVITSGPIDLHPGRLSAHLVRVDAMEADFERDHESVRSRRRVLHPLDKTVFVTGWLRLVTPKEATP